MRERESEGKHQIHLGERRHYMFTLTMESWAPPILSHTMNEPCMNEKNIVNS